MTTTKELLAQKKILDKAYKEARLASINAINTHLRNHIGEAFTLEELAKIGEIPIRVLCGCWRSIIAHRTFKKITLYYLETTDRGDIIDSQIHSRTVIKTVWLYN